ncbi:hypothetical protein POM88_014214 [Heracleum sosnowskyi]|uniref:Major facilitator superfamily (MFS) profile domain-containing protein n=1 Tax=Heracleum sosnowskyi TaxID=360622 RepID=A0AAD8J223_9APIA|nr:hypothetical protein POM88_014214 [Heracleum sosnowskyi]
MRMSAAFYIAGWLVVYLSSYGRFLTGYGIGIVSYVEPVYIAEVAPSNLRGGLTTLNQLMICVGSSLAFVGNYHNMAKYSFNRACLLFCHACGFIFYSGPRWVAKVGLEKDFEVSLRDFLAKMLILLLKLLKFKHFLRSSNTCPC